MLAKSGRSNIVICSRAAEPGGGRAMKCRGPRRARTRPSRSARKRSCYADEEFRARCEATGGRFADKGHLLCTTLKANAWRVFRSKNGGPQNERRSGSAKWRAGACAVSAWTFDDAVVWYLRWEILAAGGEDNLYCCPGDCVCCARLCLLVQVSISGR